MDRFVLQNLKLDEFNDITKDEMRKLFLEGTTKSKEQLFKINIKLIKFVLKRFFLYLNDSNYDDVYQEGALALYEAINNYDLNFGLEFSTYAVSIIDCKVRTYLREKIPLIRPPKSVCGLKYKITQLSDLYYKLYGKKLSVSDIAKLLNVTAPDVYYAIENNNILSLESKVSKTNDTEFLLMDQISSNDNEIILTNLNLDVQKVLDMFSPEVKEALELYYTGCATQQELSNVFGFSQSHISKALSKFRKELLKQIDYDPKYLNYKMPNTNIKQTIYDKIKFYNSKIIDETIDEIFSEEEKEVLLYYYPKSKQDLNNNKSIQKKQEGTRYILLNKLIFELALKTINKSEYIDDINKQEIRVKNLNK